MQKPQILVADWLVPDFEGGIKSFELRGDWLVIACLDATSAACGRTGQATAGANPQRGAH